MLDRVVGLILDEGRWLTTSMALAFCAVALLLVRRRSSDVSADRFALACMTMFAGTTVGVMAFGHLLAVSTKLVLGTLEGSAAIFFLIGAVLAAPSWMLIVHTRAILTQGVDHSRKTLLLNGSVAASLLALGLHNLPLAVPAVLNIGHQLSRRRALGWTIVGLAVVANVGLFVGSLIFMASGQSFEDFSGM